MSKPIGKDRSRDKARRLIATCLRKYGPFTTTELCTRLGQLNRAMISHYCYALEQDGILTSDTVGHTRRTRERRWTYCVGCCRADLQDDADNIPITDQDQQWYDYWQLPPYQRQALPRPDWLRALCCEAN